MFVNLLNWQWLFWRNYAIQLFFFPFLVKTANCSENTVEIGVLNQICLPDRAGNKKKLMSWNNNHFTVLFTYIWGKALRLQINLIIISVSIIVLYLKMSKKARKDIKCKLIFGAFNDLKVSRQDFTFVSLLVYSKAIIKINWQKQKAIFFQFCYLKSYRLMFTLYNFP